MMNATPWRGAAALGATRVTDVDQGVERVKANGKILNGRWTRRIAIVNCMDPQGGVLTASSEGVAPPAASIRHLRRLEQVSYSLHEVSTRFSR
jgi:hypothetical protein